MAEIYVTKKRLDEAVSQLREVLARLESASADFADFFPEGYKFGKAPDVSGSLRAMIEFTAKVDAEASAARMKRLFGESLKDKRRIRLRRQDKK